MRKNKGMVIKCDECGEYFFPGHRADGTPNGIGLVMEDGTVHNACADCLGKINVSGLSNDELEAINKACDKKLIELMTKEDYVSFMKKVYMDVFKKQINKSEDEYFDKIFGENFDREKKA